MLLLRAYARRPLEFRDMIFDEGEHRARSRMPAMAFYATRRAWRHAVACRTLPRASWPYCTRVCRACTIYGDAIDMLFARCLRQRCRGKFSASCALTNKYFARFRPLNFNISESLLIIAVSAMS